MTRTPTIIIAGGSGLLGSVLAAYFAKKGYEIVVLSRTPRAPADGIRTVTWDGITLGPWKMELEGGAAVINLTGQSVNCRYTKKNRQRIFDSRVHSTRIIGQAIAGCKTPPKAWFNASTATIYKHAYTPMNELTGTIAATPEADDAFSIEVATAWEKAAVETVTPHTRKILLRAMVLAPDKNSVYPILRRLARLGLGGTIGPGNQFVSWIHYLDFARGIDFLLTHPELEGPFNLAAPNPLPMAQFMQSLRQSAHRTMGIPTPTRLLRLGAFLLRTEPELLLKSRCVVPGRLLSAGFCFEFPTLGEALAYLDRRRADPITAAAPHPV